MPGSFVGNGVRFMYPDNWEVERDAGDDGWSVTIQSPGTAFMFLSTHPADIPVDELLETTLEALREDYPDLESEQVTEQIANREVAGLDVAFTSLDVTNTCWIRGFQTPNRSVLVMCQANDLDLEEAAPVLAAIRESIVLTDS